VRRCAKKQVSVIGLFYRYIICICICRSLLTYLAEHRYSARMPKSRSPLSDLFSSSFLALLKLFYSSFIAL